MALGSGGCELRLKRSLGGDGRGHLRGKEKQQEKSERKEFAYKQNLATMKGGGMASEVYKETMWEGGAVVTSLRAVGRGMDHSLKRRALDKEGVAQ